MNEDKNKRKQNTEIAIKFINNLLQPHYKDSFDMVNDDCRIEMPFAHDMPSVVNRENFEELFEMGLKIISDLSFTIKKIHQMSNADELIVEFEGDGIWTSTGKKYCNRYISYFLFKNGKISLYREYFDPFIIAEAATP